MSNADDLANRWAWNKWRQNEAQYWRWYGNLPSVWNRDKLDRAHHIANCPSGHAVTTEHGWECACYSEYTRDDEWYVHVDVICDHDRINGERVSANQWYSDLPDVINQMIEMDELDCEYEDEE